ncbi:MAG: hypothetical protein HY318_19405 [Armatimonadetes bacterium]|nr:hypothetical protein [Armatimonadota bacterium]
MRITQSENHARAIPSEDSAAGWLNGRAVTPVSECVGGWIWCEGEEADFRDFYLFVRGEVTLDEHPRLHRQHRGEAQLRHHGLRTDRRRAH